MIELLVIEQLSVLPFVFQAFIQSHTSL